MVVAGFAGTERLGSSRVGNLLGAMFFVHDSDKTGFLRLPVATKVWVVPLSSTDSSVELIALLDGGLENMGKLGLPRLQR